MAKGDDKNRIIKQRFIFRVIGNWGTTFLGPLVSTNVGEKLFAGSFTFYETLIISAFSACITVGIIFFNEIKEYGEAKL